eukprot:8356072-Pyramimonas_sp.AAC.1
MFAAVCSVFPPDPPRGAGGVDVPVGVRHPPAARLARGGPRLAGGRLGGGQGGPAPPPTAGGESGGGAPQGAPCPHLRGPVPVAGVGVEPHELH